MQRGTRLALRFLKSHNITQTALRRLHSTVPKRSHLADGIPHDWGVVTQESHIVNMPARRHPRVEKEKLGDILYQVYAGVGTTVALTAFPFIWSNMEDDLLVIKLIVAPTKSVMAGFVWPLTLMAAGEMATRRTHRRA